MEAGLHSGDLEFTWYSLANWTITTFWNSTNLAGVLRLCSIQDELFKSRYTAPFILVLGTQNAALTLSGASEPFDDPECIALVAKCRPVGVPAPWYHTHHIETHFWLGRYDIAGCYGSIVLFTYSFARYREVIDMAEKHIDRILAYCLGCLHHTYVLCWRAISTALLFSDQPNDSHVAGKTREEIVTGYSFSIFCSSRVLFND